MAIEKKLYDLGNEVNQKIVEAQGALASYNFYEGNKEGIAATADIEKIRDFLREAEYISRLLCNYQ